MLRLLYALSVIIITFEASKGDVLINVMIVSILMMDGTLQ